MQIDFTFTNAGSFWLLSADTDAAVEHAAAVFTGPDVIRFGDAIAVEGRYVDALASALEDDGFRVII